MNAQCAFRSRAVPGLTLPPRSRHSSKIGTFGRFSTIFTSLQAPKDDKYVLFRPFWGSKGLKLKSIIFESQPDFLLILGFSFDFWPFWFQCFFEVRKSSEKLVFRQKCASRSIFALWEFAKFEWEADFWAKVGFSLEFRSSRKSQKSSPGRFFAWIRKSFIIIRILRMIKASAPFRTCRKCFNPTYIASDGASRRFRLLMKVWRVHLSKTRTRSPFLSKIRSKRPKFK